LTEPSNLNTVDTSLSTISDVGDPITVKETTDPQHLTSEFGHHNTISILPSQPRSSGNSSNSFAAGSWSDRTIDLKPAPEPQSTPSSPIKLFSDLKLNGEVSQFLSNLPDSEDTTVENEDITDDSFGEKTATKSINAADIISKYQSTFKIASERPIEAAKVSPLQNNLADVAQEVPSPLCEDPDSTRLPDRLTAPNSPENIKELSESSLQASTSSTKTKSPQENTSIRLNGIHRRGGFAPRASRGWSGKRDSWIRSRVPSSYHHHRVSSYKSVQTNWDDEWPHITGWGNTQENNCGHIISPKTTRSHTEVRHLEDHLVSKNISQNGSTTTDPRSQSGKPSVQRLLLDRWITPPRQNKINGVLIDELTPSPESNKVGSQKESATIIAMSQNPDYLPMSPSFQSKFPSDKYVNRALAKARKSDNFIKVWAELQPSRRSVNRKCLEPNCAEDIADFCWREYDSIEGVSLDEFWTGLIKRPPPPADIADFDFRPWWRRYKSLKSIFIQPYEVPVAKLDKSDDMYEIAQGEVSCIKKMQDYSLQYEKEQKLKEDHQKVWDEHRIIQAPKPRHDKPSLNLYLRSAEPKDLTQLVQIFNHNLKTSWGVIEPHPIDLDQMKYRYDSLESKLFPLIVAVKRKANRKLSRKGSRVISFASGGEEEIIGYGIVDEYGPSGSIFHHTAELDIHVREEYQEQGIGKTLLDYLLYTIDSGYEKQCMVDFQDKTRFCSNSSTRPFRSIVANVVYAPKSPHRDITRYRWVRTWLEKFGFKKCGEIPEAAQRQEIW
jgi:L-amino acid N-acyltransferase YncA